MDSKPISNGGDKNSPLKFYEPLNFVVFMSFYSPIIVTICMLSMSFVFQNVKGFVFFGYLLACCIVRNFVYMMSGAEPTMNDNTICTSIQYSKYGNECFSTFVFAFTITYLFIPMFTNDDPNFWIFTSMIFYFAVDVYIKMYKKCITQIKDLLINILLGGGIAALIVSGMYAGGSSKFLFFNEVSSSNEQCSMPSKQTFKCSVYKNGELIGDA
jgi:hypothetical protein